MMRDTVSADEILLRAGAVGQYYGFAALPTLTSTKRGGPRSSVTLPESLASGLDPMAETILPFLKQLHATGIVPSPRQPLFLWHTNVTPGRPAPKRAVVQFHALGSDRPLANVLIIRALLALSRDLFHDEPTLRINSMGDKETRARYARELTSYFKKRSAALPEECLACAKRDVLAAAELVISQSLSDDLPSPTEHLSDASRKRFEDLLDYLERVETPFELARDLVSRGPVWNDACFEIVVGGKRVAWGSHYSELTKHFFSGSPLAASGAVFLISASGAVVKKPSTPRLKVCFIHIGDEAKRLSIGLAEELRKARVALTQDIGVESLTEQLHLVERRNSPYLLIMGRKEALEGTAILRNRATQEEKLLPLAGIIDHLRAVA